MKSPLAKPVKTVEFKVAFVSFNKYSGEFKRSEAHKQRGVYEKLKLFGKQGV
jgi:hypothetical protein